MKLKIVQELIGFLVHNKKWWLGTIIAALLLLGLVLALSENAVLAPFIYALF